jgi:membrane-bound serine protease (ClpP class)
MVFSLQAAAALVPAPARAQLVYRIPIQGEIDRSLVVFLRRSVQQAEDEGAEVLLFDINTFGGRVDSALQITTLIGSAEPLTVAYVTTAPESTGVSWSAGAIIAFSSERIFMAPGTSMGAAAPITMGAEGAQPASEKVVSAVRAQAASLAEKNEYPVAVARAMVDQDIELVEAYVDGELRAVSSEELQELQRRSDETGVKVEKGRVISSSGKLLTLTAGEMERYQVSSGTYSSIDGVLDDLGIEDPRVVSLEQTASDRAVEFITSSGFTSILILAGLVALFVEITSPGFGIPGAAAIACFAVVFSGYALLGTVDSLELILFVLGVVLLVLELFVIPGFGVAGISGIVLIVASLVLSMQGFIVPDFEWQRGVLQRNLLVVILSTMGALIFFGILAHSLPKLRPFNRLALSTTLGPAREEGKDIERAEAGAGTLVGKQGIALTTLRPVGKAEIEDEVIYVETEGEYLPAGSCLKVIQVTGNRVVVRKC